jgi:alpha-N-arabinofuranosidase
MMVLQYLEKRRSLDGWSTFGQGSISLSTIQPLSDALPVQMRYSLTTSSTSASGFRNGGFSGMNIQAQNYTASFFYRTLAGASVAGGKLNIGFSDSTGQTTYSISTVDVSSAPVGVWSSFSSTIFVLTAAPSTKNIFFIEFPAGSKGDFEFNLVSCFPPTFKNRTNGARIDIAQAFADLKPGYVRLPGGNDLEGYTIPERFIWNNTVGPLENRPGRRGTWTGYNTEGFGLIELLTFVEDIGATPVLAVYAGYSLNGTAVPEDQLQPYIDEVVKELDFLTASADNNRMGALRKRLGRSQPFDIKYVEIGNEDGIGPAFNSYSYRWSAFFNALYQKYPNITFIATTTKSNNSSPAVDDHNYQVPLFFIQHFRLFEYAPRPAPKILVGEFQVMNDNDSAIHNPFDAVGRLNFSSIKSAVAESIYRIGFERNSDIVIGGCYAPVLQNIDYTQWAPNLIVFNAGLVVKSASYLAQKMFGEHLGNILLNSTAANSSITHQFVRKGQEGDGKLGNLYFVATKRINDNTLIVKLASIDSNDLIVKAQIQGSTTSSEGVAYILTAGPGVDPSTVHNTIVNPTAASITTKPVSATDGTFSITVPSWSVVVVTLTL